MACYSPTDQSTLPLFTLGTGCLRLQTLHLSSSSAPFPEGGETSGRSPELARQVQKPLTARHCICSALPRNIDTTRRSLSVGALSMTKLASHASMANLFKATGWAPAHSEGSFWTSSNSCDLLWPLRLGSTGLARTDWSIFWNRLNSGFAELVKIDVGLGPVSSATGQSRSNQGESCNLTERQTFSAGLQVTRQTVSRRCQARRQPMSCKTPPCILQR